MNLDTAGITAITPNVIEQVIIESNNIRFIDEPGYSEGTLMIFCAVNRDQIYRLLNHYMPIPTPDVNDDRLFFLRFQLVSFSALHTRTGWELTAELNLKDIIKQVYNIFDSNKLEDDCANLVWAINNFFDITE